MGLAKLEVSNFLKSQLNDQWLSVSVKLSCFQARGANFNEMNMPFSIATKGSLEVSLANIEILAKPKDVNSISIDCD